jgi:hypothetical protein
MSRPAFALFREIIQAWVLCPGRRTVTELYQQVVARRSRPLVDGVRLASVLSPTDRAGSGRVVELIVDDTFFHKAGRTIERVGVFRDPVRSSVGKVVYALGLDLVVVCMLVKPPLGGEPLALPVNLRLYRKGGPTHLELVEEMIEDLATWAPSRWFHLVGDGYYAPLAGYGLPRTHVTSRLRSSAALDDLPPGRTEKRGRPRKRGKRLPKLSQLARQVTDWQRHELILRNRPVVRLLYAVQVLWYEVCREQPILLVIVRDPTVKSQTTSSSLRISTHGQLPLPVGMQTAGRSRTPSATASSSCVGRRLRCGGASCPNALPLYPFGCAVPSGPGISRLSAPRSAGSPGPGTGRR